MKSIDEIKKELFKIPDITYHYTSLDSAVNILQSSEIWLTKFDYLNDPTELVYTESLIEEVFQEKEEFRKIIPLNQLLERIVKQLEFSFIFSLSNNNDCLGLWTYYSQMSGLNIHFSKDFIKEPFLFLEDDEFFTINSGKVIYDKDLQKQVLRNIFENLTLCYTKKAELEDVGDREKQLSFLLYNCFLLFKQKGLKNEEEFRYVYTGFGEAALKKIKFRVRNDLIIPYINFPINLSSITGFTLSPDKRDKSLLSGLKLLCSQKGIRFESMNSEIILR